MAETLGTAEVLVTANVEKALQEIERVSKALGELESDFSMLLKTQGFGDGGGGNDQPRNASARDAGEFKVTPQLEGELKNIPFTIDTSSIADDIQAALNQHGAFRIKIELDTSDIQNLVIPAKIGDVQGSGSGSNQPRQISREATRAIDAKVKGSSATKGNDIGQDELNNFAELMSAVQGSKVTAPDVGNYNELLPFMRAAAATLGVSKENPIVGPRSSAEHITLSKPRVQEIANMTGGQFGRVPTRNKLMGVAPLLQAAMGIDPGYETAPQTPAQQTNQTARTSTAQGLKLDADFEQKQRARQAQRARVTQEEVPDTKRAQPSEAFQIERLVEAAQTPLPELRNTRKSGRMGPEAGTSREYGGIAVNRIRDPNFIGPLPSAGNAGTENFRPFGVTGQRGKTTWDPKTGLSGRTELEDFELEDGTIETVQKQIATMFDPDDPKRIVGGMSIEGVDITGILEMLSSGLLNDVVKTDEGYHFVGRDPKNPNKKTLPPNAQQLGQKKIAERMIRRAVGQGGGGELSQEFFDAFFGDADPKIAQEYGDVVGLGAPFLKEGARQSGRSPALVDKAGAFTEGPQPQQSAQQEFDALNEAQGRDQGQNPTVDRTYDAFASSTERDKRAEANREAQEAQDIALGRNLELGQSGNLTLDEFTKVMGNQADIKKIGAERVQGFLDDMVALRAELIDPTLRPEDQADMPRGDTYDENGAITQGFISSRVEDSLRKHGLTDILKEPLQMTAGKMAGQYKGKAGGLISTAINAITDEYGMEIEAAKQAANDLAGQDTRAMGIKGRKRLKGGRFVGEIADVETGGEPRGYAQGRVLGGEATELPDVSTGDDMIAQTYKNRGGGQVPPEELAKIQAAAIEDAVNVATGLDSQAGAMAVTIASPVPLPVTIVGGGGGDGGPPRRRTGGGKGSGDGDGGDEKPEEKPKSLKQQEREYNAAQEERQLQAAVDMRKREQAAATERRNLDEVNLPGVRLPALTNLPENIVAEEEAANQAQESQANIELQRQRQKAAKAENRQRVSDARSQLKGTKYQEDPDYDEIRAEFARQQGITGRDFSPEEELLFNQTFPDTAGIVRQRNRKDAAAARANQPDKLGRALPSESRLQAIAAAVGQAPLASEERITPQDILREDDAVLAAQRGARASIRQARGRIPQRALSTSIVQIAENLFGGVEKPLSRIAEAEQEFGQLGELGREQGRLQRRGRFLQRRRAQQESVLRALRDQGKTDDSEEVKDVTRSLEDFKKKIDDNTAAQDDYGKQIADQTKKVERLSRSAVGASDILRNLGAGFIGGVGGGIVTQAVSQVTTALLQAYSAAAPTLDRQLGGANVAAETQQSLAQAFAQGGFSNTAMREALVTAGLDASTLERFEDTVNENARAVALAGQMDERRDLLFSEQNIARQTTEEGLAPAFYNQVGGVSLPNPFGGRFEWGGSDSPFKVFAGELRDAGKVVDQELGASANDLASFRVIENEYRRNFMDAAGNMALPEDEFQDMFRDYAERSFGITGAQIDAAQGNSDAAITQRIQEAIGDQLAEGYQLLPGANRTQVDTIAALGGQGGDLASALRDLNISLADAQGNILTPEQIDDMLMGDSFVDPQAVANVMGDSPEFQNQMWAFGRQRQRAEQQRMMGTGFRALGNQIVDAGATGRNLGIAGGASEDFLQTYGELQAEAEAFEQRGIDMLTSLMPSSAGLIEDYQDLGDLMKDLNQEAGRIQADQAMRQYTLSVKQATFAVEDLQALTGKAEGSEIGRLERVNMLMQRRLQILQFEQQQRNINFQVAVAGFQAEGMTGAERAARLQHARREAAVSQEMLNLNRGMFGNQVQIVDQRNIRALEVATDNLNNIVATFNENKRLAEISNSLKLVSRNHANLEAEFAENMQTVMAVEEMRDGFLLEVASKSKKTVDELDKQVLIPFDTAVDNFIGGADTLGGTVTDFETKVAKPMTSAADKVETKVKAMEDLMKGKDVPGLTVRDVTINQKITGTVVDYKELVDLIVEELSKQGIRTGNNA